MLVRNAATVMLLRDAPDLEVFMLRRSPETIFASGAYVYPGGAVDVADSAHAVSGRVTGVDDGAASRSLGLPGGGLAFWVAAIRETFEEAGLLLASTRSGTSADADRLDAHRRSLNSGEVSWSEILDSEDLVMEGGALRVFAHFLTPAGAPRRYDTWFFAAAAPEGQEGVHDDGEAVHSEWVRPSDALARNERADIELIMPTIRSLRWLERFETTAAVLAAADAAASASAQDRAPLVVSDTFGERIALDDDEMAVAVPGWRPLSTWTDAGSEREGVA
ncbi:MAG: NUDIX domain-containing protein [Acidimicrobiia bacterium]|nr:NUDIX domain-containing protein [Acidimicrobiia bacterium]